MSQQIHIPVSYTHLDVYKRQPHRSVIAEKYQKNIVDKASFKHYFLFFKAKTFLGSEALVHAIDLRVACLLYTSHEIYF